MCGRCKEQILGEDELDAANCSMCKIRFHFECSTITESSWRTYGPKRRGQWKCSQCKMKMDTASSNNEDEETLQAGGKVLNTPLRGAGTVQPADDDIMDMRKMMREMTRKWDMFDKDVRKKLDDYEANMKFYGDSVEEVARTVKEFQHKMIVMEKRLDKSEAENKELKTRLKAMEVEIQESAQKDYLCSLEISGIKDKNINPKLISDTILTKAGLKPEEIKNNVKLMTKKVGEEKVEKTILSLTFQSPEVRNEVLAKMKSSKVWSKLEDSVNRDKSYIFINEALSPYYRKLFYEARKVKIDKKYKYLWVQNGNILLKKTENSRIIKLSSMEDLGKM